MPDDPIDLQLQSLQAVIHTEQGPILIKEFADFLSLFRTAYAATVEALVASGELGSMNQLDSVDRAVQVTSEYLSKLSDTDVASFSTRSMEVVEPFIVTLRRENPIELILGGIMICLVVATILSGGKLEITLEGIKIELPPLGDGIKKLKEALRF